MAGLSSAPNAAVVLKFIAIFLCVTALLSLLNNMLNSEQVTLTEISSNVSEYKLRNPEEANIASDSKADSAKDDRNGKRTHSMYTCGPTTQCAKLKHYFAKKWNATKPKAAVYILSRGKDAEDLKKTLTDLETNFLSKFRYPVIIFYEKDFVQHLPAMRSLTKLDIFFQEVEFEVPPYIYPFADKAFQCAGHNLGYRHMCRFHSKTIYELPLMLQLEYYLRLDAHSFITQPVPYDLFKDMKEKGLLYLYPCIGIDAPWCVTFLWDAVKTFIGIKRIKPEFFNEMTGTKMFYNNFEMARMDVFTAIGYQNYINYIDQLGGTYHNRWGDAPIKSLGVSIFVPRNKTRRISGVTYYHKKILLNKENC